MSQTNETLEQAVAGEGRRAGRLWLRVAAAAVVAVLAVAGYKVIAPRLAKGSGPANGGWVTAPVTKGDLAQQVAASGTLSPRVQVQVGSQVSGRVKELHADYNDVVKAGQVIARIDPLLFQSAVSQARARLAAARAGLARAQAVAANATRQYERGKTLDESGAIAASNLDTQESEKRAADSGVIAAEAEVTQARASLEQAEVNLAYTTIKSPIDGVVVSRSVDVGQTVAASLSAPTLFVIAQDMSKMEVHTSVAEADVGQIIEGMPVRFTVDAYARDTFRGRVKQVRFEATTVQNVVTYDAVVEVDNPELKLRPGMTAQVTFVIAEKKGVLLAPAKALRFRPAGAPPSAPARKAPRQVHVLRAGKPTPVEVELGITDGTYIEIVSGLAEGDEVIISAPGAPEAGGPQGGPQGGGRRMGPPRIL